MPFELNIAEFTATERAWYPVIDFLVLHRVVKGGRAPFDTARAATTISASVSSARASLRLRWWTTSLLRSSAFVLLLGGTLSICLAGVAEHSLELVVLRLPLSYRA